MSRDFAVYSQDDPCYIRDGKCNGYACCIGTNLTGSWHLKLTNGVNINLILFKSGSQVFGRSNVTSGNASQGATAKGSYSGSELKMNVVPADGKEHYSLSLDLSGQTPAKTYSIFSNNTAISSGTVRRVGYTTEL